MPSADVSTREYVERMFSDWGKLCQARMQGLERSMAAAFSAMGKAQDKAEMAQQNYNVRSNEFRGQLDDQAKTLMPRTETQVLVQSLEDRINRLAASFDARYEMLRTDLATLRDFRSDLSGRQGGFQEFWGYIIGAIALVLSLISIISIVAKW